MQLITVLLLAGGLCSISCAAKGVQRRQPNDEAAEAILSAGDQPPVILHFTRPQYPRDAFDRGLQGTVELQIVIDESGRVSRASVMRSVPGLDEAAIRCVMAWRFRPALKGGQPVAAVATAPVTFRIYKQN